MTFVINKTAGPSHSFPGNSFGKTVFTHDLRGTFFVIYLGDNTGVDIVVHIILRKKLFDVVFSYFKIFNIAYVNGGFTVAVTLIVIAKTFEYGILSCNLIF